MMALEWPSGLQLAPMGSWPGVQTPRRRQSAFDSTMAATLELLRRELRELGAREVALQVAIAPEGFRLDGRPRAGAVAAHPGVILTFESRHGSLSYPCDTFDRWEDNLRAIALALEALRKVDRYGVTRRGEQYRGFLALEAPAPSEFASASAAHAWLGELIGYDVRPGDREQARGFVRHAKRKTHPDLGGLPENFQRVVLAEAKLRAEGWL